MTKMYIEEYKDMVIFPDGGIQIPMEPPIAFQEVNFTTSTASAAFNAETRFISLQLESDGYIQFAAAPTAVNTGDSRTSHLYKANDVSFHGVNSGLKVAAVDSA